MRRKVETRIELIGSQVNFPVGFKHLSKEDLESKRYSGSNFMRKEDLLDGEYYFGDCRNARCARWSEKDQEFTYMRTKFGDVFPETINHPDDFDGFDVFTPLFRCYPTKKELIPGDLDEADHDAISEEVAKRTKGIP